MPLWPALKEENMKGLQRYVRLLICAVLALCSTTQEAMAQAVTVAPHGAGEHLLFAYWSTAAGTNTQCQYPFPARHTVRAPRLRSRMWSMSGCGVRRRIGMWWPLSISACGRATPGRPRCPQRASRSSARAAVMTMCKRLALRGVLEGTSPDPRAGRDRVPWPIPSTALSKPGSIPTGTLKDDAVWPPDADFNPDHATPRYISGLAMLVSPRTPGFRQATMPSPYGGAAPRPGRAIAADTDDGNGCWALGTGGPSGTSPVAGTDGGVWIRQALRGVTATPTPTDPEPAPAPGDTPRDLLLGRWTAIVDAARHLLHHGRPDLSGESSDCSLDGTADPVSVHVYDDDGTLVLRSTDLTAPLGGQPVSLPATDRGSGGHALLQRRSSRPD